MEINGPFGCFRLFDNFIHGPRFFRYLTAIDDILAAAFLIALLLQGAQATVLNAPWAAIAPGVMIVAIVLGANFLADGLRERFDPTRRTRA